MPNTCPLSGRVDEFVNQSRGVSRSLRKLRYEFSQCPGCPDYDTCALRATFLDRISAAVQDLTDEWNLAAAL